MFCLLENRKTTFSQCLLDKQIQIKAHFLTIYHFMSFNVHAQSNCCPNHTVKREKETERE